MMNKKKKILAIVLVLTSLLITCASVHQKDHQEVISKDGHRVVVVEVDGTTKVSISPPDASDTEKQPPGMFSGPRDLICDAYGKCKHKVVSALEKTKGAVTKGAQGVADEAQEVKEHTKEVLNEAVENSPREAKNKASEKAKKGVVSKAKKLFGNVVSVVKDGWSKDFDVIDSPKRIAEDISRNVTGALGKAHKAAESVKEQAKKTLKKVGDKSLNEAAYDVIRYLLFRDKVGSVVSLVHMLGFSTAYGMCVWVTFVSSYVLGRYLPRQMFGVVQSRIYPAYFRAMACCISAALFGHLVGQKTESLASKIGLFQILSLVSALLMVLINMIWLEPKATKAMYRRMKLEKEEGRGVGIAVAAKDGMADRDGVTSMVNGKGGRVADGGGDTVVRSVANGRGVRVAVKDNGMANGDGMTDGGNAARSVGVGRQDVLKLNERLKKLNAYSSALNMFTLVALTWHMAYMGQRLQGYTAK